METRKAEIAAQSRTGKMWIQYMDYMDVIKMFIRVERSGIWDDHLVATAKMLNRALPLCQKCTSVPLNDDYPWLYQQFKEYLFFFFLILSL